MDVSTERFFLLPGFVAGKHRKLYPIFLFRQLEKRWVWKGGVVFLS